MIYSPAVPILKDEEGNYLDDLKTVSILTAPAVNTGAVKRNEPKHIPKIEPTMRQRIAKVLAVALDNKHEVLVLGAWGCGVFQNNPIDIALYFQEILDSPAFRNRFSKIVFAIYARDERFIRPFQAVFEQ